MKIAAVIVTYNRLYLLKEVLKAFDSQTRVPDYIIVVNNASTDGTDHFLKEWSKTEINGQMKIIIKSEENIGGSGGFYIGTEKALSLGVDWVWVSDDDAIPNIDVFEKAYSHLENINTDKISAICTKIVTDGRTAVSNRSIRVKNFFKFKLIHVPSCEYDKNYFECDHFSYVGVMMNVKALKKVGLINKDYFIWRDDVEHSWRLSEYGKIICFTDMVVNHKVNVVDYEGVSWKTYYAYRNDMLMFKSHKKKIYYYNKMISAIIRGIMSGNKKIFSLYINAIYAAKINEKGVSRKYRPGMKIV